MRTHAAALLCAGTLLAAAGMAQEPAGRPPVPEDLELTMTLLPEGARRSDMLRTLIELPKNGDGEYLPSPRAVERSARGLETANLAREYGRDFGRAMAESAQQRREEAGRGSHPALEDARPTELPDPAQRPETPASPRDP